MTLRRQTCAELLAASEASLTSVEDAILWLDPDVFVLDDAEEPIWLARVLRHRGGVVRDPTLTALRAFFDDARLVPMLSRDDEVDLLRRIEILRVRRRQLLLTTESGLRAVLDLIRPDPAVVERPDDASEAIAAARTRLAERNFSAADRTIARVGPRATLLLQAAARLPADQIPVRFAQAHAETVRVEGWLWAYEIRLVVEAVREIHRAAMEAYLPALDRGLSALDDGVSRYSHRFGGRLSAYISGDVRAAVRGG